MFEKLLEFQFDCGNFDSGQQNKLKIGYPAVGSPLAANVKCCGLSFTGARYFFLHSISNMSWSRA